MKQLGKCQQQLEITTRALNIKNAVLISFERTQTNPFGIDTMVEDLLSEFPRLKDEDLIQAIRSGGLGKYGRTYKLCTQEVCIWIREFLKEKNHKNIQI